MDERLRNAQNIIFDIGNVLLHFDLDKVCSLLPGEIRQPVRNVLFTPEGGLALWQMFDLGALPNEEIARQAALKAGHPGCEGHILKLLEEFPRVMTPLPLSGLLRPLRQMGKRIFALTNYPEPSFTRTLSLFPFLQEMEGIVVSSREKCVKPGEAIFHILLEKYSLSPAETLFIDDSAANVATAVRLGLQGWHYTE